MKYVLGNDPRNIKGIYGVEGQWQIEVGDFCDRIICYIEDGDIPWFAIEKGGKIWQRVNSRHVETVVYFD